MPEIAGAPASFYHLLDRQTDPLISCEVYPPTAKLLFGSRPLGDCVDEKAHRGLDLSLESRSMV